MLDSLTTLLQPWADLYSNNTVLSTAVLVIHVLSMFIAGGMAIGADRAILRAVPGSGESARAVVADMAMTHTIVLGALTVTAVSGVALFTSDIATFAVSKVYWAKMLTVCALLANGLRLRRSEGAVMRPLVNVPLYTTEMPVAFLLKEWGKVRSAAAVSMALWCLVVVLGVVLMNV